MRDILKRNPIEVEAKEVGFKLCWSRRYSRMYGY
jgi:hypothetical protein